MLNLRNTENFDWRNISPEKWLQKLSESVSLDRIQSRATGKAPPKKKGRIQVKEKWRFLEDWWLTCGRKGIKVPTLGILVV
jgi:hypothetical protein